MSFWKRRRGGRTFYVQLLSDVVVLGEDTGNHHHDPGTSCTREEFLAGRYNDVVRDDLGEKVLAEVLEAIKLG